MFAEVSIPGAQLGAGLLRYTSLNETRTNVSSLAYLLLHYREPAKRQRFQESNNADFGKTL